jgi:elongation factor Ts
MANFKLVKQLRQETGLSLSDCVKALNESSDDLDAAKLWLRAMGKKSLNIIESAKEGWVGSYVHHNGRIGVLVEINCQTDFAAKTDEFKSFAKNIALQVASASPKYVSRDDVPEGLVAREKSIIAKEAKESGRPAHIIEEKIIPGRLNQFFSQVCILEQPFVKEPKTKIGEMLCDLAAKLGEKIAIKRFTRYEIGLE